MRKPIEYGAIIDNRAQALNVIGDYYEDLAACLFGGKVNDNRCDLIGDVLHDAEDVAIEVKGSSDTHSFRIFIDQLNRHVGQTGFPYARCWYALFRYHSPDGNSALANGKSVGDLRAYLGAHTAKAWLLDAGLVQELASRQENGNSLRRGEKIPTFRLGYRTLWRLGYKPCTTFVDLGLNQTRWRFSRGRVYGREFEGVRLDLEVFSFV